MYISDFPPSELDPVKILMIGNGFDLAHGLPTSYIDFLNFTELIRAFSKEDMNYYEWKHLALFPSLSDIYCRLHIYCCQYIEKYIMDKTAKSIIKEFLSRVENNMWIDVFNKDLAESNKNWIDFESDISKFVQNFEALYKKYISNEKIEEYETKILDFFGYNSTLIFWPTIEWDKCKKRMIDDLNRLIEAFEIYLTECVEKINIEDFLPDIRRQNFEYVLSFNYTNTYERVYTVNNKIKPKYDYIHGKINSSPNNMVLGISEYLIGEERDKNTEYIEFKKYFQRIHKKTGCRYKQWLETIRNSGLYTEVHILGHSLDITDGDIIKELMLAPNTKTIIYHHSQEAYGKQIAALVKILGQDTLIGMVHGISPQIVFEKQDDSCPLVFKRMPALV